MVTARRRDIPAVATALTLVAVGTIAGAALGASPASAAEFTPSVLAALDLAPDAARADRDVAMAWAARVLLVLALAWLLIGMLAAQTRLVRRPGAAAARATWLASTRPWRARESTLGMLTLDRVLLVVVPVGLLVATRAVQTSFLSWSYLAVDIGAWVVFAAVARLLVGPGRSPYPLMAAVGGVVVLRCVLSLAVVSVVGPGGYWSTLWESALLRFPYIVLALGLLLWVFVAGVWATSVQFGARRAIGIVLASAGSGLVVPAVALAVVGLDRALALWHSELGFLPPGLGVASYVEVPGGAAWLAAGLGAALCAVGLVLALSRQPAASVRR